jgi:hypothetical protein
LIGRKKSKHVNFRFDYISSFIGREIEMVHVQLEKKEIKAFKFQVQL